MENLILVSHGEFTEGLKTSLGMFAGDAINRVHTLCLYNGESAGDFKKEVNDFFDKQNFNSEDEFIVLADIVGGNPLATFSSAFSERRLMDKSVVLGGMNFTMALTAAVSLDAVSEEDIAENALDEARQILKQYEITSDNSSDDDGDIWEEIKMTVSLVRIDDRMIHGLIITRWAKEVPCDGITVVNDKAHDNPILKEAYKSATEGQGKKCFVWIMDHFKKVQDRVLTSNTHYLSVTKSPLDMETISVDRRFKPSDVNEMIVGPDDDRPGVIKLGDNQSFTQEEGDAFEAVADKGYKIHFALLPGKQIGYWDKFKGKFGY